MASINPLEFNDDNDEEFDWEAAVREIDAACQNTKSSSLQTENFPKFGYDSNKRAVLTKQSTLDKFMGTTSLRRENPQSNGDRFTGTTSLRTENPQSNVDSLTGTTSLRSENLQSNGFTGTTSLKTENPQSNSDRFTYTTSLRTENWQANGDRLTGTTSWRTENESAIEENQYTTEVDERASGVKIDPEAAKTWIYPANYNLRDYQFNISQAALFSNTLVVLPTGLGKTLIAAVVMYNYFRWFPEGKIVFAAPSRPLVTQQIKACHEIVGIPQEWTIEMTGQISPLRRADLWKDKRVFFLTPQVLEKDIQSGICLAKQLVCLVIDEAHRASGNYAYCVAVRELMAVPVQLRILALSATPGSKQQEIQHVIDTLQISRLEYRSESDDDVKQYVHDKTVDLITVAMDSKAVEVNDMLCEVIRPFVNKLSAYGVLPRRDFNSFSPCELLKSRENFRQAPPQNLAQVKYGEVEGNFTVLLTLYHIKKLLSSHGIRPAFDMLDDKLQTGSLSRFMSKNETLWKVKVLMQQRLSSGVLGPKLLKMLEVLIDHFKNRDAKESRVIIFSNFRGSVRDILNALGEISDIVKATEFIGQSSGKALKGQSQKVQQAVLEKFRAGEYNVIVATSIGEEGLDIMEVDLVLCFDANISPLRMIQRMGRTGRNSKGRVVVLCYEGPELCGYKQKKQKGNSVMKHMKNGGTTSFDFHSSPRMVPHIFKPEVQVVRLDIEDYHRRGKKPRDDQAAHTPISIQKLTDAENNLIEKYFDRVENNNTWRPSLIAFPHFQAIPSRVNNVKHSFRTGMLIDAMQHLQESIFSRDRKESSLQVEKEGTSGRYVGVETSELHDDHMKDLQNSQDSPTRISESDNIQIQYPPKHSYLFGSDFVSVDTLGNVLIRSVPLLPLTKDSLSKCTTHNLTESHNCSTTGDPLDDMANITLDDVANRKIDDVANTTPLKVVDELNDDEFTDFEFSPRLTNLIKSGVVPESPIEITGECESKKLDDCTVSNIASTRKLFADVSMNSPVSNEKEIKEANIIEDSVPDSPKRFSSSFQIVEDIKTPVSKISTGSCSQDWRISSLEKSRSVEQERKYKRLRKFRDHHNKPLQNNEVKGKRGLKKIVEEARFFIDEEAEVSQHIMVSDDEDEEHNLSSYEDSFIDDRINSTAATTQNDSASTDMMAIYRRSLLTQSPMVTMPSFSTEESPSNTIGISTVRNEKENSLSSTRTCNYHTQIPQITSQSTTKTVAENQIENQSSITDTRKRKLSFYESGSAPVQNLVPKFPDIDMFDDDDGFFASIDLDAVEAEASKLLKLKSTQSMTNPKEIPKEIPQNGFVMDLPSFDLGI